MTKKGDPRQDRERELAKLLEEVRALRRDIDALKANPAIARAIGAAPDYEVLVKSGGPLRPEYEVAVKPWRELPPDYEVAVKPAPRLPPDYEVAVRPPPELPPDYEVAVRPPFRALERPRRREGIGRGCARARAHAGRRLPSLPASPSELGSRLARCLSLL